MCEGSAVQGYRIHARDVDGDDLGRSFHFPMLGRDLAVCHMTGMLCKKVAESGQ